MNSIHSLFTHSRLALAAGILAAVFSSAATSLADDDAVKKHGLFI